MSLFVDYDSILLISLFVYSLACSCTLAWLTHRLLLQQFITGATVHSISFLLRCALSFTETSMCYFLLAIIMSFCVLSGFLSYVR